MKHCHLYAQHPNGTLMKFGTFNCGDVCESLWYLDKRFPTQTFDLRRGPAWKLMVVFYDGFNPGYELYVIRS